MKKTFALVSATTLIFATTSFAADIDKKEIAVTRSGGSSSARTLTFDSNSKTEAKDEINIEKAQARGRLADSYKAEEDTKREVKLGHSGGSAAKLTHKFD